MNVLQILNTIRANSSAFYQERIPVATKENLTDIGSQILTYSNLKNEFIDALITRVAFVEVSNRRYKNPLAVLKSDAMPFGNTWEEIHVNPAKAKKFDGKATDDLLSQEPADVETLFHKKNRADRYKITISHQQLQTAFLSVAEMGKFIQAQIDSMYSGDEIDEYALMKGVVVDGIANNYLVSEELEYDGGEQACKELIKFIKTLSSNFTFASKSYNGYNLKLKDEIQAGTKTGRVTWTPKENQVLLIRSDVDAATDVEVLAKAFNMEKTEFIKRKFVVDDFGDTNTLAVVCDERLFKFKDVIYTLEDFRNGSNLTTNNYLHHHQVISVSLFANCVAIKQKAA